ncbi:hypothetical protein ACS0TY_004188 [Phlomoides rotata]
MESGSSALDLSFGFDDPNFSDRTLLLEIISDAPHTDDHRPQRLWDVKCRRSHRLQNLKRRCTDTTLSPPPRVKTIHITSLILAARSRFFRKLFSNGMQESEQKHVTLRIEALEETSFMDMLKYVYSSYLPTTLDALRNLLVIADKFEVDSCSRDCTRALQKLPMTRESASVYLDLPPSLLMSPIVEPLLDAAKQFLVAEFKELDEFREELLHLPLPCLQAVLSSDDLHVTSEIVVYNCVLDWVHKHYPDSKERQEILETQLLHLVRFPFMTTTQLTEVETCNDIDREVASKIVTRALFFKAETDSHLKRCLAAEEDNAASRQFVERGYYIYRPVKVVELELSCPRCLVYLDLTRNELKRSFPMGYIWTEGFHLGGLELGLSAHCYTDELSNRHDFLLALEVLESLTPTLSVEYEFLVIRKPQEDFEPWFKGDYTYTLAETKNFKVLHSEEWTRFIDNDSPYFINDILHVMAKLTIK